MAVGDRWSEFARSLDYTSFAPHSRILDVGCGTGWLLEELRAAGHEVVGLDPDVASIEQLRKRGLDVHVGVAEQLSVESRSVDGIVCRVVLPLTDERRAILEWGRVLRPGGRVRASYHGMGYYVQYLIQEGPWKRRVYGARSLVNTWVYAATGRRLPGWVGDTIYQSRRRLSRHYREAGLRVIEELVSAPFGGSPVYIYHVLERLDDTK